MKAIQIVTTLFVGLFLCFSNTYAADAAAVLNQYWKNTNRTDCGSNDPDYYCSGVIVHVFDDESFLHSANSDPWMPNDAGIARGSVSFSYLRQDISVGTPLYLSPDSNAGYIFIPIAKLTSGDQQYTLFCDYPQNADSDHRIKDGRKGCGNQDPYNNWTDLSTCKNAGVTTPDEYVIQAREPKAMCSASPDQAGFKMMLDTIKKLTVIKTKKEMFWNELVIQEWSKKHDEDVPIAAFFYEIENGITKGKDAADAAASSYRNATHIDVPVVAVDVNKLISGDDAPFSNEN